MIKTLLICNVYYILTQVSAMVIFLVETLLCMSFSVSIYFLFCSKVFHFYVSSDLVNFFSVEKK